MALKICRRGNKNEEMNMARVRVVVVEQIEYQNGHLDELIILILNVPLCLTLLSSSPPYLNLYYPFDIFDLQIFIHSHSSGIF